MKKLTLIIILLSLVIISNPAYAKYRNDIPIWEQVEKLVCVQEYYIICNKSQCSKLKKTSGNVTYIIDFVGEKVIHPPATEGPLSKLTGPAKKILNSTKIFNFHGKYFKNYGKTNSSVNSILLHGSVIKFDIDKSTGSIRAIKSNGIFKGVKGHPNPVAQTAKLEGHFSNCSAPNISGTTSRLSKLKELEESGLITKEEAAEKRKAILDGL